MSRSRVKRRTTARASSAKPRGLTRNKVIDAGLMLLDKSGAEAVTMRGVADAVGARQWRSTTISAASETSFGHRGEGDRLRRIRRRAGGLARPGSALLRRASCALPQASRAAAAPRSRRRRAGKRLRTDGGHVARPSEAGLDDVDSLRAYFLLTGFTLAQAAYQSRPIPALELSEKIRTERIAGRGDTSTERLELPATWDFDASFAFGVALVLNGVEATVSRKATSAGPPDKDGIERCRCSERSGYPATERTGSRESRLIERSRDRPPGE